MARVPYNKPALSYSNQLQQLKDRGLIVEDDTKALHILENISYYRLSAYWYPMLAEPKSNHKFKPRSSFDQAFKLYCFDRELRQLISSELEKIEVAVRAKMIYILAHNYGPFWYDVKSIFADNNKRRRSVNKLSTEYDRSDEEFIRSFSRKYSNTLPPSWMILEISSFGNLSNLYSNLKPGQSKRDIANYFGLDDSTFGSWLHTFTYVRNVCAHHSRFWNKRMSIQPQIPLSPLRSFLSIHNLPNPVAGGTPWRINDRAYFVLSMVIYLLEVINPKHSFNKKLDTLFRKYPMVDKKAMGYPNGWQQEPVWSRTKKDTLWKKIKVNVQHMLK